MNKIDRVFAELKASGQTALMPFITVGDPDPDTTIDILKQVERAGAHIVELGVPYSDPLADGPVIQRASLRALKHNVTIATCIQTAAKAREAGVQLPFILFSYFNPVLQIGIEECFAQLKAHDISGIIIPDLPMEEDGQVREIAERYNIHLIPLVAPTSANRIAAITSKASGFIYCVSSLGVTGERASFDNRIESFIRSVKETTDLPVAIGFGISNRSHVETFSAYCDAVIVGSAIVRKIEEIEPMLQNPDQREEGLEQLYQFVNALSISQ